VRGLSSALRQVPWWLVFGLSGFLVSTLYAFDIQPFLAFAVIGAGSIAGMFIGPRWHRAQPRGPWVLMGVACILFLLGALIRPTVVHFPGPLSLLCDACTVPGYVFMIAGFGRLIFARRALERHALIDVLIVSVGAALASALLLGLPAAALHNRPIVVSTLAGLYPLLDAILVLMLVGDVAYAIIGLDGELAGSRLLDLPFLLAFTGVGSFSLHPSIANLGRATVLPIQAWSWQRLLVIGPALAVPFVLMATIRPMTVVDRLALAAGGALLVGLLLVRAVSAVSGYAAAQRKYAHQATHDPLTGLPNRRMLTTAVEQLLRSNRRSGDERIWMLFLDLDGFKFVNDTWGHPAGDDLITDAGNRLRACMPESVTVARVGGDEFVIVEQSDRATAMALAQRALDCLSEPLRAGNADVVITASMGISSADPAGPAPVTAESLMREADTAMYRTKSEARGTWTEFDTSMHEAVRERIEIELALRTALAQEQLHVVYQPIVELTTGAPLGAEALARWDDPVRGPIPPSIFVPIAEGTCLIAQLGAWVLRDSIRQLATWRRSGVVTADFWMSVNVSPRQLTDPELPAQFGAELRRYGVPAANVVLEITESVMVQGSDVTERVLLELRDRGARISVDDFGTGFSALGYLRSHPVTGVKIDRSFVTGLGSSTEDEEIVRAIAAMSDALGLSVVAEGVETTVQRDVLAGLGVVLGQGWLWGRGIGPEEFAARWAAHRRPADIPSLAGPAGPARYPATASASAASRAPVAGGSGGSP
jgi:diguanylate cyclase (GGDEF)-like protein